MDINSIRSAVNYFTSRGWTSAQAAGIVANLQAESGLRPDAVGDGGLAYGIAQWHPDRQARFSAAFGKSIVGATVEEQLAFVHVELNGAEKAAGVALRACTDAVSAGACVSKMYERPADREGEAAKRGTLAQQIYVQYGGTQPAAPIEERTIPSTGDAMATPTVNTTSGVGAAIGAAITAANPIAGLVYALGGTLINAFSPLVKQKIAAHYDNSSVGQQIAESLVNAAVEATGGAIPGQPLTAEAAVKAVAAAQADPQAMAKVEQAAVNYIDQVSPLLDKINQYDKDRWAAQIEGADAAAKRAQGERWDMTPSLVLISGLQSSAIVVGLLGAVIWAFATKQEMSTIVGLVGLAGPLMQSSIKNLTEIFAYRFDGTKESAAQTQLANAVVRQQGAAR